MSFITSKFALISLDVELSVAFIACGLQAFFGFGSTTFNAVVLSRKAVASTVYYAYACMGAVLVFGIILNAYLGNWSIVSLMSVVSTLAYAQLYLCAVPVARWLLTRPSVIVAPHQLTTRTASESLEATRGAEDALRSPLEVSAEHGDAIPASSPLGEIGTGPGVAEAARMPVQAELPGRAVQVNITLPEEVLAAVDRHAERQGYTRSGFLAHVAREATRCERDTA